MQDALIFASFLFVKLNASNVFNAIFQKRETMVQKLQSQPTRFFLWILHKYLKNALLDINLFFHVIRNVNFEDANNQKALGDIDVGAETHKYLDQQLANNNLRRDQVDAFLRNCLHFYITANKEIRNRLPFDDYFLACVAVLRPEVIFKGDSSKTFGRVWKLCQKLGSFDQIAIGNEWKSLFELNPEIEEQWSKLSFDEMCVAIGVFTTNKGGKMFPNLSSLLSRARTLSYSNAEAERAFSMLTDAKTSKRSQFHSCQFHLCHSISFKS